MNHHGLFSYFNICSHVCLVLLHLFKTFIYISFNIFLISDKKKLWSLTNFIMPLQIHCVGTIYYAKVSFKISQKTTNAVQSHTSLWPLSESNNNSCNSITQHFPNIKDLPEACCYRLLPERVKECPIIRHTGFSRSYCQLQIRI